VVKFFFTKRSLQFSKITNESLGNPLSLPPLALLYFCSAARRCADHHRHLLLQKSTRLAVLLLHPLRLLHRALILSPRCVLLLPPFLFSHRQHSPVPILSLSFSSAQTGSNWRQQAPELALGGATALGARGSALKSGGLGRRSAAASGGRRRRASGPRRWCGAGSGRRHGLGGSAHRSRRRAAGGELGRAAPSGWWRLGCGALACGARQRGRDACGGELLVARLGWRARRREQRLQASDERRWTRSIGVRKTEAGAAASLSSIFPQSLPLFQLQVKDLVQQLEQAQGVSASSRPIETVLFGDLWVRVYVISCELCC
jgi:hypothetical protein